MMWDFSWQNRYSWWRMVLYSWLSHCSREYKKVDGCLETAVWSPRSRANRQFFHWKMLPNWVLFQSLIRCVKKSRRRGNLDREEDVEGMFSEACQLLSIRAEKEGSMSHICLNLKGLGDLCSKGLVSSKMGQWLDLTLSAMGKRIFHSKFPTPLYNCSFMLHCQFGILLVQVKRGP